MSDLIPAQPNVLPAPVNQFAIPAVTPLKRLAVRNGLLLDAERWRVAHDYHRQRQNLHYQALHLPGIVCGLAVSVTAPPDEVSARYRDERWLQISAGMAIDAHGNLIVVDQPLKLHLATIALQEPQWVYLVIRHVDPEGLQRSQPAEIVAETFRLDEKTEPPGRLDVEICRILLPPGDSPVTPAADVFCPGVGELDLRQRQPAQLRPQATVRVAYATTTLATSANRMQHSFAALLAATKALYPPLQGGNDSITEIDLNAPTALTAAATNLPALPADLAACDLLYLTHQQCLNLSAIAIERLNHYLDHGGVVMVELPGRDGNFEELQAVVGELQAAVTDLQGSQRFADLFIQLKDELLTAKNTLESRLATAQRSLEAQLFGPEVTHRLQNPDDAHPLRSVPFTFSQWPPLQREPLRLYATGGLVLVVGDLSQAWGPGKDLNLPRDRVRAAQELGINLLQFAWQRHHRTQTQQGFAQPCD
ncbi:MAG: DUF4159 domain-containing protein [Leptolyngbyaceae cyanobacterium]